MLEHIDLIQYSNLHPFAERLTLTMKRGSIMGHTTLELLESYLEAEGAYFAARAAQAARRAQIASVRDLTSTDRRLAVAASQKREAFRAEVRRFWDHVNTTGTMAAIAAYKAYINLQGGRGPEGHDDIVDAYVNNPDDPRTQVALQKLRQALS